MASVAHGPKNRSHFDAGRPKPVHQILHSGGNWHAACAVAHTGDHDQPALFALLNRFKYGGRDMQEVWETDFTGDTRSLLS